MKRLLFFFLITFVPLLASTPTVIKLEIKGAVGPASSDYIKEGMVAALQENAQMILIELDTPGGLSTSMREMIQEITNSTFLLSPMYLQKVHVLQVQEPIFSMHLMWLPWHPEPTSVQLHRSV